MSLNDLLTQVAISGSTQIEVKHLIMKHGNEGQAGDYRIMVLTFDGKSLRFKESPSGWSPA